MMHTNNYCLIFFFFFFFISFLRYLIFHTRIKVMKKRARSGEEVPCVNIASASNASDKVELVSGVVTIIGRLKLLCLEKERKCSRNQLEVVLDENLGCVRVWAVRILRFANRQQNLIG
jgi:hypothetical protein